MNQRRCNILVAQEFLIGTDVAPVLEEVVGERVAEGVTGRALGQPGSKNRAADGLLEDSLVQMVAAGALGIRGASIGG